MKARRYAMLVDTRRCVGCHACVIACKTENDLLEYGFRCWIAEETKGTFPRLSLEIRSERCNHCTEPPCVVVCPTGATRVSTGGIVVVGRGKCVACGSCVRACPYGSGPRYLHPDGFADKCTFCWHRVTRGKQPACVSACPAVALSFGDLSTSSELQQLLRTRKYKTLHQPSRPEPNVFFLL